MIQKKEIVERLRKVADWVENDQVNKLTVTEEDSIPISFNDTSKQLEVTIFSGDTVVVMSLMKE